MTETLPLEQKQQQTLLVNFKEVENSNGYSTHPRWGLVGGSVLIGLGILATLLAVGALFYCALAWKNGYWGVAFRIYYTLVTVAAAGS